MEAEWADMHVHTTASDGLYSPEEAVERAVEKGLSAIAIADHDNISGIQPASRRAMSLGNIRVIPAVELSCEWESRDVHVLGYFIDMAHPDMLRFLSELAEARHRRLQKMIARLHALGVSISVDEVLAQAGSGVVGRPHLARILAEKGYAEDEADAFAVFLERGKPAYVERYKIAPEEAVERVLEWGGVPFLAHPGLGPIPDHYIRRLVAAGLQGLEVKHPAHSRDQVLRYCQMATELGLLISGGSDTHGPGGEYGNEVGDVRIPMEWVRQIETSWSKARRPQD